MARFRDKTGVVARAGFFNEVPSASNINSLTSAARHSVVHNAMIPVKFSDGATAAYTINVPAGAVITNVSILPSTAFNAGTTNQVKVGSTAGGADLLALTNLTAATATVLTPSAVEAARAGASPVPAVGTVYVTLSLTGTAATTGAGYVGIQFVNTYPTISNSAQ